MAPLSVASYNTHGFNANRISCLETILIDHTFVLVQEHWLHSNQLEELNNVRGSCSHAVSGMPSNQLLSGRPFGGCAIMWSKSFKGKVEPVQFQSSRVCGVIISMDTLSSPILLVSVYMPVDTLHDQRNCSEFRSILLEIIMLTRDLNISSVIVGGDFNTDLKRRQSLHTKEMESICHDFDFIPWINCVHNSVDFSYESYIDGSQSLIDHFIISRSLSVNVDCVKVIHLGNNLSDHSIISMSLSVNVDYVSDSTVGSSQKIIQWDKASETHIKNYKTILDRELSQQNLAELSISCNNMRCDDPAHLEMIDFVTSSIVKCCIDASESTIPTKLTGKETKVKCIPGWSEKVEPLKRDSLFWHSIWLSCGSPKTGVVAGIRRRARALYHRAVRLCKKEKDSLIAKRIAEAFLEKNTTDFWKYVRRQSAYKQSIPSCIDNMYGDDIAEVFSNKYEDLYNSAGSCERAMNKMNNRISHLINIRCCKNNCTSNHAVSTQEVISGVKLLKANKKEGCSGHSSNHLIHGTTFLYEILSNLLSSMLHHGYASPDFRLSVIIPIVKNKQKSASISSNYRGIALSSIIAKLMDIVIIEKERHVINSSDYQFGYKEKSSTTQCTFVINEVIQYYLNNGGSVYATFLDASKAFDSVKFDKLFKLLIDRDICPLTARFLAFIYMNQTCVVKWCSSVSSEFTVGNGVKQGGVLSPRLFNIYLDVLLINLEKSGVGCYIGKTYMGSFAYADDIVLLSPTVSSLYSQLKVCESYSVDFNIIFNADKSKLIVYGKLPTCVTISFQGDVIPVVTQEKHIGNLVGTHSDLLDHMIQDAANTLYGKFNLLIRQFGAVDTFILYQLFNTYCLSLYGSQLFDLGSTKTMEPLYVAWRKCVRKILGVPYNTHCNLLPLICKDSNIAVKLHKRFLKFIVKANKSKNICIQMCIKHLSKGSMSTVSNSWNYICYKYSINRYELCDCVRIPLTPPSH